MKVRIWDLPTRLFHWGTVLCFAGLVLTGEIAGDAMVWHFRLGYALLALLLFRVVWGFVGGYWSRFSSFVPSPAGLLRYVRDPAIHSDIAGHNPLGALSVMAMVLFLFLQVVCGLMSDDEVFTSGPLVGKVPAAWSSLATYLHTEVGKRVLIVLVLVHIVAIAWYRFKKKEDLLSAMLGGDKQMAQATLSSRDDLGSRLGAAVLLALCGGAVAALLWWAQNPQ